ncbi:hypothetical protein E2493_20200 [Sphingomonas parva]|uniref:Uncharacterized protein n=1 Tax=Sphingomonas parva TaxID=2555898 RepID=A0A4Y8ZMQ3_9SPHN|nr:hypothetical protein [Sphingomonas parva]TFI56435.1 hypothetical protein E2493_20200 [Sphingomonas parva]
MSPDMSDERSGESPSPENPNPDPGHGAGDMGKGSFDDTHKGEETPSRQGPTKVPIPHHEDEKPAG